MPDEVMYEYVYISSDQTFPISGDTMASKPRSISLGKPVTSSFVLSCDLSSSLATRAAVRTNVRTYGLM